MYLKGFRFGLLLQIAIGPVFIFVLKTATQWGIWAAEAAAFAATLIDGIFVTLAIIGIGNLIDKPAFKKALKYFGVIVLIYFGAGTALGAFNIHIIPGLGSHIAENNISGSFLQCLVLTVSNPLTILFWTGVFASRMSSGGYTKNDMKWFGAGAVTTTFVFLGLLAFLAGLLEPYMTDGLINGLNLIVGILLIAFSIKLFMSKSEYVAPEVSSKSDSK